MERINSLDHEELVLLGKQVLYDAPQLYIDIDIEADGKAGAGSMLSIGAIAPAGETFYTELQPISGTWIPEQRQFCEEHKLERSRLAIEGINPYQAIRQFVSWTNWLSETHQKPPVFSAFNASFDFGFIDLYIYLAGLQNPYGVAPFDLKSAAQELASDWDWRKTSKGNLPSILVPENEFTHHALEDATYQQQIHFAYAGLKSSLRRSA